MEELNKKLYDAAKENGCCEEWLGKIEKADVDELISIFKKGIDYTAEHEGWISNRFIVENFDYIKLKEHNVYVNTKIPDIGINDIYVMKGSAFGKMDFVGFSTATLHVFDECDIDINASEFSRVFIHAYGNCKLTINQCEGAKVFVYLHSYHCMVDCTGNVTVRSKK